jgi:signal peptidase
LSRNLGAGELIALLHFNSTNLHCSTKAKILTKGDNNPTDDTALYAQDQKYLNLKDIIGSVVAYIPFVGYVTILLSEHPWLKTVMLGIMGLVVVLQRE